MNAGHARSPVLASWLLASVLLVGCDQEQIEVFIDPQEATVSAGESFLFTARVEGAQDPSVKWSVQGDGSAGIISEVGVYTAPATPGTYEVKVSSVEDPDESATATVTVIPATSIAITLAPNPITVRIDGRQTFSATVTGSTDTRLTWRVEEGQAGGTVSSEGTYSAPSTAGTYHVIATSVVDPRARGSVTVTVTTSAVASVTISPVNATVLSGQFFGLDGTVYGVTYTTPIKWSVVEPDGGGVTSNGLYLAPPRTGVFHVAAAAPSDAGKRAVSTLDVRQPTGITLWIAPRAPTVPSGGAQTFAASVSGSADQRVTWSLREASGGTITPEGVYTAPTLPPGTTAVSYTLVATSTADPTKRAEAPILVTRSTAYSVSINPSTLTLRPGASMDFTSAVSAVDGPPGVGYGPTLVWRVLEGAGGSITSGGRYTAPSTPGTYHVAAEAADTHDTLATVKVE